MSFNTAISACERPGTRVPQFISFSARNVFLVLNGASQLTGPALAKRGANVTSNCPCTGFVMSVSTHGPLSSSFLGLPYRNLNINHNKELLRGPVGKP